MNETILTAKKMPSPEIETLIQRAHAHHLKRGGKSYAASPLSKRAGPCVRFGEDTGKTRTCPTCSGKVELKVFGCSLHGECTPALPVDGVKCCARCNDFLQTPPPPIRSYPPIGTRHLIYHIYPVSGNGVWQRNVALLRKRLPLFNGRRRVAVAIDPPTGRTPDPVGKGGPDGYRYFAPTDSLETVRKVFGTDADSIEFIEVANDPNLREVVSFLPLFEPLSTDRPDEVIFYGQAKGVTRPLNHPAHRWAEVLHHVMFDHWPLVQSQLERYPCTGAFKKIGRAWSAEQSLSEWHYSGSWFVARSREFFSPGWRNIRQWWGGIESYLSERFAVYQTGSLFMQRTVKQMNLYNPEFWRTVVEPALVAFDRTHANSAPRVLNLGCGPHSAVGWLNVDVVQADRTQPDVLVNPGEPLPFPDGHFERAYLGHILEHVRWDDVPKLLKDVCRVVKRGGEVCILGPDSKLVLEAWKRGETDEKMVWDILEDATHHQYEAMHRDWDGARHFWNATAARVVAAMAAAGFANVREVAVGSLGDWPVVDRDGPYQSAVMGESK